MENKKFKKGILFAFLTSIISGIAIFYSKISLTKINPLILTTSRNLYVGFLFILLFIIHRRWGEIKKLKRKQLFILILIGLIGGWLPFYLFFTGLQFTQAIAANLIHKTLFIWVTILAFLFLKEKFNFSYLISFFLIGFANFYLGNLKLTFGKGELMVFIATILWSIENILAKKVLKTVSSETVGLFRMGTGSILLFLTSLATGKADMFPVGDLSKMTVVAIGGTILFFYVYTWYKALKYAPASLVTLILTFSVIVGNILNGAFAGIKLMPKEIYSSIFIGASVFLIFSYTLFIPYAKRHLGRKFSI
ncbi:hypothetical protein A3C98_01160 [Candidatus Roizmanbacteria bacterium RIFCSPHIGHO2_02_FULL_37_15]|uniref:EamA domain-containing protein n=1 Tax=Candidatus Roizmanbacteria bacterium RIFCSPLOWO2_01_FULL_37_16 TaxID=1802058 RepID=A0A1F7IPD0_9BACT|nr:MAG: hypothetical protein A2859_05895 [Candidatus Roizmanbacteria bacterium RIFCSPHIGHO2_01_FULL_37_16b]OGK22624.1 MAG: hypothetical protein A3C98_01160 [Candidatus Roizmanbacteria bacterium RIFCSPHIGHO2_02_FULL_37_15]OGK34147.1 MAG: hypothetical protein A3F57_00685 [Candidatus Roizmanbacteria bacterium RIFCSPHIGHO2_12_FULL_36_11]OGK45191.1 MAG: hypothetical protein A3B40_00510 [Candidatus Roizmanbacteria bacterium RIFCSPLOWO2_01_FULL_37_16]OGK55677.1 MAG: hypothetical protein A3I50_04020 [C